MIRIRSGRHPIGIRFLSTAPGGIDKPKKTGSVIDPETFISGIFGKTAGRPAQTQTRVMGESVTRAEITPASMKLEHILPGEDANVPCLSNGLDRVLFNPGVHVIRDLRTNVYNFDPDLQKIAQPEEINFECLPKFVPPFKDQSLRTLAKQKGAKFVSSTSSFSASLGMIYYVVSNMRQLNLSHLSSAFAEENRNFTLMTRAPTSVILRPHEHGIRSIVTEKVETGENILSLLGQSLEKALTLEKDQFRRLLKGSSDPLVCEDLDGYAHTLAGNILIRSQLDCYDPRLPRRTFDLKTRATLPIRMDVLNYHRHLDYQLRTMHGLYGSYEREFYDMCRSALLKYNFQVRLGNMDGIFVAYHNTAQLFGFQYLSREAMDECLFGNGTTGEATFSLITKLYNELLERIVPLYSPKATLRLTFSISRTGSKLTVFVEEIPEPMGKDLVPDASRFRQFTLSTYSTLNGARTSDILLNPMGGDAWKLFYTLAEVKPDLAEFMSARSKLATLAFASSSSSSSSSSDDAGMVRSNNEGFFRGIQESIRTAPRSAVTAATPPIIADWTLKHR